MADNEPLIIGDFNAIIKKTTDDTKHMRKFGLGQQNYKRNHLVDSATENNIRKLTPRLNIIQRGNQHGRDLMSGEKNRSTV